MLNNHYISQETIAFAGLSLWDVQLDNHYYDHVQGLFQDFAQEGANALWQILRGGKSKS